MAPAKAENSVAGKAVFKIWIKASLFNKGLLLLEFSLDESAVSYTHLTLPTT